MYHVRKASDHDERSLHMENDIGLHNALEEAGLRTHRTGETHEVVDDNGRVIATAKLREVVAEPAPKLGLFGFLSSGFFLSAFMAAVLLAMMVKR